MLRSACLLGLALCTLPVAAQVPTASRSAGAGVGVHRLDIRDGRVYHDGTLLPEDAVPEYLDIEGMSMSFEYSGPVAPAIGLDGQLYTLEDNRLVRLDQADMGQQAFGLAQPETLGQSAAEQAERAYLRELSERDGALYERLVREREMEGEALRLARQLRQNPANAAALRAQLREKLDAMFELKQENRREEIRQVEDVLEALRQQLRKREAMRDQVIQHRMGELTGR
ncbi:MAG: hypothetical protein AAGI91_05935 [Bacteroidota bacterium]